MDGKLEHLIVALVLFVTFGGLITYAVSEMGETYGKVDDNVDGGSLTTTLFTASVDNISSSTENFRRSFEEGKIDDVDDPTGIWATTKKFISLITTPFTLLGQVLENVLHIPKWVINVLLGLLGISLILGIWSVIRTGR